jgi:hypothetical protein
MKLQKRNLKTVYACTYIGEEPVLDINGYETGEKKLTYSEPIPMKCNVSPEKGRVQIELFGNNEEYDRVILPDKDYDIDESTVLFVDKEPEFKENGSPEYDYVIKKVARSLNVLAIAASKVKTS